MDSKSILFSPNIQVPASSPSTTHLLTPVPRTVWPLVLEAALLQHIGREWKSSIHKDLKFLRFVFLVVLKRFWSQLLGWGPTRSLYFCSVSLSLVLQSGFSPSHPFLVSSQELITQPQFPLPEQSVTKSGIIIPDIQFNALPQLLFPQLLSFVSPDD